MRKKESDQVERWRLALDLLDLKKTESLWESLSSLDRWVGEIDWFLLLGKIGGLDGLGHGWFEGWGDKCQDFRVNIRSTSIWVKRTQVYPGVVREYVSVNSNYKYMRSSISCGMCALCIQHSAESTWRPIRLLAQVDGEGIKVDWWMTDLALVSASGSVSVDLCLSLSFSLWCRHVFRWWLLCPTRGMVRGEDKSQGKVGMDEVYVRSIQVWKSRLWVWTVHLEDPHVVVAKTNLTSDLLWRTPRASLQIGSSGVWCWITSARIMITAAGWMGCDDVVEPRDARRVPRRVPDQDIWSIIPWW